MQPQSPNEGASLKVVDEVRLTLPTGELVLASGKVVRPVQNPAVRVAREIKSGREAAAFLERTHRKLGDLPETPEKMNAIAAVLMYTGVGLSDNDIAVALRTSTENISRLKELDAYKQLSEMFDATVFEDAKRTANHVLARASANAAKRMVDLVEDEDAGIALAASRDVTRLAGVGVDKPDEGRISGLNIKIVRSGDKKDEEVTVEINSA